MRKISVVFYCTLILIVVSCHSCKGSKQKKDAVSVNDSIINQVKVDSSSKLKVDTIVGPGEKNDFISSKMEIPFTTDEKKTVVHHTAYSLLYSEEHEQAIWIAYELTKEETKKAFDRSDKFIVDPDVKTGSANDKDYRGAGYDRGHLAPAADMSWSNKTMLESFYFSNMSPQDPSFNRGIWKKLEELVRYWANENNSLYVVTGPILSKGLPTIGGNKVSVPNYYYKVLLDYSQPDVKAIGFILENKTEKASLSNFAVSIDSVEAMTGLNFFPNLPDKVERDLESKVCISCWSWKAVKTTNNQKDKNTGVSLQCKGSTKSGSQCKRKTSHSSGFCQQHQ